MNFLTRSFMLLATFPCAATDTVPPAKPVAASQLGVDRVTLKSGRTLRGAILQQAPDGSLSLAVPRDWLRRRNPELFEKLTTDESAIGKQAREQLRDRLKMELSGMAESSRLAFFLSQELERVERELAGTGPAEPTQFVWLRLQRREIGSVARAAPERQRTALWAWDSRLADVESRDAGDLARELKDRGIDLSAAPPDLSDRLPLRLQDEREWTARIALVSYALGDALEFQGTGDLLVRSGEGQNAKQLGPLIVKMLRSQIDSLTSDLTTESRPPAANQVAPNDWLKPAIEEAERLKARAFRATRVNLQPERRLVEVQTVFVVRFENRGWEPIWSARQVEDSKVRADAEARIAADPQVKAALELMKTLGIGGDEHIQQAIRFGAATMAAQQAADTRFFEFRDRLLKKLTGPPL